MAEAAWVSERRETLFTVAYNIDSCGFRRTLDDGDLDTSQVGRAIALTIARLNAENIVVSGIAVLN